LQNKPWLTSHLRKPINPRKSLDDMMEIPSIAHKSKLSSFFKLKQYFLARTPYYEEILLNTCGGWCFIG